MKVIKKLTAAAVCMTLMMGAVGIQASAATVTQDGLNASLTTDKTEYKKDEPITATLTVENTSGTSVKDVNLENIVPEGYELAKDYSLTKSVDELKSNDKVELTVVYNAKTDGKKTTADGKAKADDSKPAAHAQSSTSTTSTGTSVETAKTGDTTKVVLIVLIIVAALVIGIICFKKKKGKQLLSIAVCASVLSTAVIFMQFNACAADETKTISVSQDAKVDGKGLVFKANISYSVANKNTIDKPSDSSEGELDEADVYYKENATVISVTKAKESADVLSEEDVQKLFSDRGFDKGMIFADYDMDGNLLNDTESENKSEEKHPLYKMLYGSKSEILWNIYVINGVVSAYPVSYNLVSKREAVLLITETDTVTSYDYTTNQFYETIPKDTAMIVRKVSRIDKTTLDSLTIGGLSKL